MSGQWYRCCEHCADDSIHDIPAEGHSVRCSLCDDVPDVWRQRAEKAEAELQDTLEYGEEVRTDLQRLRDGIAALANEWETDPSAGRWHAVRVRALLDGAQ